MRDGRLDGLERTIGANRFGVRVVCCIRRGGNDGLAHFELPESGAKTSHNLCASLQ